MKNYVWNPWHGCDKYSEGCKNCYVYRRDTSVGRDASQINKNSDFDLPIKKARDGSYKIPPGSTVYSCMTSDFFIDRADCWRNDCWDMIYRRRDVDFVIITKRIVRFEKCIPDFWNDGLDNVAVCCTAESQRQADIRLPIFKQMPIKHKMIVCEPLLTSMDIEKYLDSTIERVVVGGESGNEARICDFEWVSDIRYQCKRKGVPFYFKQTGANFRYNGRLYRIPRKFQHLQAKKANISQEI